MDAVPDPGSRQRSSVELPGQLTTPGVARRFAARALRGTPHAGLLSDDVALLVSELVTNAVLHTDASLTLTVETSRYLVRIEIRDSGPDLFALPPTEDAERGRGLPIVDRLAHAWGVDQIIDGKLVWAELRGAPHAG